MRHRLPDLVARERVVGAERVAQRHRLGLGQVARLGGPPLLPRVDCQTPSSAAAATATTASRCPPQ